MDFGYALEQAVRAVLQAVELLGVAVFQAVGAALGMVLTEFVFGRRPIAAAGAIAHGGYLVAGE
ncbi:hypothetical protein AB0J66_35720 [Actinoplanes sp. NPDC049598]|uniref:hypothetical protein n=1 Tax=Actinoplanes sp. NPDC049598 TaxID=3154626 RepID=UPI003418437E